tara:strand:+ start:158 stop:643 length:486 start_codon:yes stop_codon:yes gene_type:complete
MKKIIFILILSNLFSENLPPQSDIENMTISEKKLLYDNHNKSIPIAMSLNLILPLPFCHLGFAYINDWKRGLSYDAAYMINMSTIAFSYENGLLSSKQLGNVLVITNIVLYIYKSYDLIKQTTKYNHDLYKSILGKELPKTSFDFQPSYEGANLTISYSFN